MTERGAMQHDIMAVFCDRVTHRIRGYVHVPMKNIHLQEMHDNEIGVVVERQPNLAHDLYVDPATGEMSPEPFVKAIAKA